MALKEGQVQAGLDENGSYKRWFSTNLILHLHVLCIASAT
jgi:hypothetical protein